MNIECYPAHGDEHGGGEVDGEDVRAEHAGQDDLHPVDAVVLCNNKRVSIETIVLSLQLPAK